MPSFLFLSQHFKDLSVDPEAKVTAVEGKAVYAAGLVLIGRTGVHGQNLGENSAVLLGKLLGENDLQRRLRGASFLAKNAERKQRATRRISEKGRTVVRAGERPFAGTDGSKTTIRAGKCHFAGTDGPNSGPCRESGIWRHGREGKGVFTRRS